MAKQGAALAFPKASSIILCTQFIDQYPLPKVPYSTILPTEYLFHEEQGGSLDSRSFNNPEVSNSWRGETAKAGRRQLNHRPNRTKRPLNSWMAYRSKSLLFS